MTLSATFWKFFQIGAASIVPASMAPQHVDMSSLYESQKECRKLFESSSSIDAIGSHTKNTEMRTAPDGRIVERNTTYSKGLYVTSYNCEGLVNRLKKIPFEVK